MQFIYVCFNFFNLNVKLIHVLYFNEMKLFQFAYYLSFLVSFLESAIFFNCFHMSSAINFFFNVI